MTKLLALRLALDMVSNYAATLWQCTQLHLTVSIHWDPDVDHFCNLADTAS